MIAKWDNLGAGYKEQDSAISKYSAKACKAQVDAFLKQYQAIEGLQENLPAVLIKARGDGVAMRGRGLNEPSGYL